MKIEDFNLNIQTNRKLEVIDITSLVEKELARKDISKGIINIFSPHTTTAISVNEPESGLLKDIEDGLLQLVDWNINYRHNKIDQNAAAHLVSSYIGCQKTLNYMQGRLQLGTWQALFFIELDGPRSRRLDIRFLGE